MSLSLKSPVYLKTVYTKVAPQSSVWPCVQGMPNIQWNSNYRMSLGFEQPKGKGKTWQLVHYTEDLWTTNLENAERNQATLGLKLSSSVWIC